MHDAALLRQILTGQPVTGVLEAELIPVDRILQRWAVSIGSGLPRDDCDEVIARVPQLDFDTAIIVDRIISKETPEPTKVVIVDWYKRPFPPEVIARRMRDAYKRKYPSRHIPPRSNSDEALRAQAYKAWHSALLYMRRRFENSGHPPLVKMLRLLLRE